VEHFGIDLHQKHSDVCGLAESGEIVFQERIPTTETRLRGVFGKRAKRPIILESSCLVP
jgi:hypothetical protein